MLSFGFSLGKLRNISIAEIGNYASKLFFKDRVYWRIGAQQISVGKE
jgi:hypothetical protein